MPLDTAYSVCPHDCPSACALDVERIDGRRIGAIRGAEGNRYTAGVICAKVARYAERVHHADRLQHPLRRVGPKGEGRFERISWDEALDEVADRFRTAAARHGAESVWPYYYAGTMGLVQRDGINRLRNVMGYSGQLKTICSSLIDAGWRAGIGAKYGPDTLEIAETDLVVIWGSNPVHTQVNLMHHIAKARKHRGATMVVVDPYRTGTAAVADRHIAPRPGTDGALACAMMHVMFRDGLADRAYMARYADAPEELEAHLRSRTPAWAAAITGLSVGEIEDFARLYGSTKRAMIRVGYGFSRSRNGAAQVHAVTCLPTVSGAWQHKGGGAIYSNTDAYRFDLRMIDANDRVRSGVRQLDMCRIGPILNGDLGDLGDGPPVTAMLIQNTNPMAVAPDSGAIAKGLAREDLFVCVHEQFLTETARMADIVLPATTFLEHDDLYYSLGHSHLHAGPKAIEPLAEARCNHEVICGLARRLGAEHPAFAMTAWEIADWTLRHSGHPGMDELRERRWIDCQPEFRTAHHLDGFPNPIGRFRFAPDWASLGPAGGRMPRLPDHFEVIDRAGDEHPYRLVTAPSRQFLNTSFTETPTSQAREGRPTAKLHPDVCTELGLTEGDRVRLGNRQGSVVVHVAPFDGLQRGVVIVEGIWPNRAFVEGKGINHLISADAGYPGGGGVFHDTAVWILPA
jgi:anaerobic selenocysteine-containing dehydrogenase